MTNKTKTLLWAMLIILVTACTNSTKAQSENAQITATVCSLAVSINGPNSVAPDTAVTLAVDKVSAGWEYSWEVESVDLTNPTSSRIEFTPPETEDSISVSVTVRDGEGCEGKGSAIIDVVNSPSETATMTPPATATNTPTLIPTAVPSATPSPTETATQTPGLTNTPQATATTQPTAQIITDPVITQLEYLPGGAISVAWSWDGELTSNQNFAVRFWSIDDTRPEAQFSITWTKERNYQFGVNNADFPIGTYYINVAVVEGSSEGIHYELAESADLSIILEALPPPTRELTLP